MKPVLLDTGCIVALLDKSDHYHRQCVEIIPEIASPFITCEAVITECCYLLRNLKGASEAVIENVEKGIFSIPFQFSVSAHHVKKLMKTYTNVPMEFADACLVAMAEEFSTGRILTLDSDFNVYRWQRNKKFENLMRI